MFQIIFPYLNGVGFYAAMAMRRCLLRTCKNFNFTWSVKRGCEHNSLAHLSVANIGKSVFFQLESRRIHPILVFSLTCPNNELRV